MLKRSGTLGIDSGTTNSSAAYFDGRAARMIEMEDSTTILPSVVTFMDDNIIIGADAIAAGKLKPEHCFKSFKRQLDDDWTNEDTGYQTIEGPDGKLALRGPNGQVISPVQLTSYVIYELLLAATRKQNDQIPRGVRVCVPATFKTPKREAVRAAARLAIEMLAEDLTTTPEEAKAIVDTFRIETMDEPTAAALAFGYDFKKMRCIAVPDLGGGTFDISIIRTGGGKVKVLATGGIERKGGIDWDRKIAEYVINRWRIDYGTDLGARDAAMGLILREAEEVKKRLSGREETVFKLNGIDRSPEGVDLNMEYVITREIMDEITAGLRQELIQACQGAIEQAKLKDPKFTLADIHDVILVGGMTRVQSIQADLSKFFGKQAKRDENPQHVVAMGAAIQGSMDDGRNPNLSVDDITPHTFALEHSGDVAAILFLKGSPYPAEIKFTITNELADQRRLSLRVLEGEEFAASDCAVIGRGVLDIEPGPAQSAREPLLARLSATGQLSVICRGVDVMGGSG